MDRFDLSDSNDGRRHPSRYAHDRYLTPHHANEDLVPRRRRARYASDDMERRRHSTGRDYRPYDHSRHRVEDRVGYRRAASSRPTTRRQEEDERVVSRQAGYGEHHYHHSRPLAHHEFPGPRNNTATDQRHLRMDDLGLAFRSKPDLPERSIGRVYGEHILAPNSGFHGTPEQRLDARASQTTYRDHLSDARLQQKREPREEIHDELILYSGSSSEPSKLYRAPNIHYPISEEAASVSYRMEMADHHLSRVQAGNHRYDTSSSIPPQESNKLTRHTSIRPSSEVRRHSYQDTLISNSGRRLSTSEALPEAQFPHFPASRIPSEPSQITVFSIPPDDSQSEPEATRRRSRLGSDSLNKSTSALSLPLSTSGSSTLGPKNYQYLPLGDEEFRLLRILPERMSKLKCEIEHRSLEEAPDYIAISYAWGDGVDTKPLVLQGATIPVAASLYDALKAVRQKKAETLVWVDALCIDQQNKDERAAQVRLMGYIYSRAVYVAIWLGPEADNSALAIQLIEKVAHDGVSPGLIRPVSNYADFTALSKSFQRDYWKRLWVVQEVLLAKKKMVYCGRSILPWESYRDAADALWDRDSEPQIRQGPSSFPKMSEIMQLGDESLLEVMLACRKKLSENPRDKVFGILGLLPEATQREFPVDYSQSVKTVYTDVVDHLITTTDQIDVLRESIHFPFHVNTTGLPSWCPDWSHIPEVSGLDRTLGFDASRSRAGPTKAQYRFHDGRRKLEISAIRLDVVRATGIAVGTVCDLQDYLTAFLHWRAILLHKLGIEEGNERQPLHEAFCRTLCLGQVPTEQSQPHRWHDLCYHVFSSLIREKLPRLPMDKDLECYVNATGLIEPYSLRKFLQDHFGNRMMGRSLCITEQGLIGMGSGYMTTGDLVVVPFGCSTPILLRPEDRRDEYRYVGDVYIEGYMHGEAVQQLDAGVNNRVESKYMLC